MHSTIKIGKTTKTHGFGGKIKIRIDPIFIKDITKIQCFFINNVPYFVETLQTELNSIIVKFDDLHSKEDAQKLLAQDVFADSSQVSEFIQNSQHDFVDYNVYDKEIYLGKALGKIEMPSQYLLNVLVNNKEILIPINDHFITSVDEKQQQIILNLPDNYIESF